MYFAVLRYGRWLALNIRRLDSDQVHAAQYRATVASSRCLEELKKQDLQNDSSPADPSKCGKSAVLVLLDLPESIPYEFT